MIKNPNRVYLSEDERPSNWRWLLLALGLVVLVGVFVAVSDNDKVIIIDDSPNVVIDDDVVVATTDSTLSAIDRAGYDYIYAPANNMIVDNDTLLVTEVLSDNLFEVSDGINGPRLYAYLDATLDDGASEQLIDINVGDRIEVSGVIISDFSNRSFTSKESQILATTSYLLLVDKVGFIN